MKEETEMTDQKIDQKKHFLELCEAFYDGKELQIWEKSVWFTCEYWILNKIREDPSRYRIKPEPIQIVRYGVYRPDGEIMLFFDKCSAEKVCSEKEGRVLFELKGVVDVTS
jgi:hypothetical protein